MYHPLYVLRRGHIGLDRHRLSVKAFYHFSRFLSTFHILICSQRNVSTKSGQDLTKAPPQATRPAGDQNHAIFKIKYFLPVFHFPVL
ncbi:hypothetical protein DESC_660001 [Desulfosarcina cetonica]|nr:hypothetical protein DESC_660001 [Desulfosarcina cetonica]